MKRFILPLMILTAAVASAAEPWICTTAGRRLIYEESIGGVRTGTLDKLVASDDNGEITLTYTKENNPIVERWRIYPDSTVLQIEVPAEMQALLDTLQVRDVDFRTRNLALPAEMNPGDLFPGFGFSAIHQLASRHEGSRYGFNIFSRTAVFTALSTAWSM